MVAEYEGEYVAIIENIHEILRMTCSKNESTLCIIFKQRDIKIKGTFMLNDIIAHGIDAKKVYHETKTKFPKMVVFLGQVPRNEAIIL